MDTLFYRDTTSSLIVNNAPEELRFIYHTLASSAKIVLSDADAPGTKRVRPVLEVEDDSLSSLADTLREMSIGNDLDQFLATVTNQTLTDDECECWLRVFTTLTNILAGQSGIETDEDLTTCEFELQVTLNVLQASSFSLILALDGDEALEYNLNPDMSVALDAAEEEEAKDFFDSLPDSLPDDF